MEMEMLHRIQLGLAHYQKVQVEVPVYIRNCKVSVKEIHSKACKELDIKPENWKYFVVVAVEDGLPVKKCKAEDEVKLPLPVLYLYKWLFDVLMEQEMLSDPASVRLLRLCARDLVHFGHVLPSPEDAELLDECENPDFMMEIQFVKLCQKLPHYMSRLFAGCKIMAAFPVTATKLQTGETVSLLVTKSGVQLLRGGVGFYLFWTKVKAWSCDSAKEELKFEVAHGKTYTSWLVLTSRQCQFIGSVISEVISASQRKYSGIPGFLTSMIHRISKTETAIDNPLFAPTAQDNPLFSPAIDDDCLIAGDRCNNGMVCRSYIDLSFM